MTVRTFLQSACRFGASRTRVLCDRTLGAFAVATRDGLQAHGTRFDTASAHFVTRPAGAALFAG